METLMEKQLTQTLESIREDVRHVRSDVDLLKAIILEDSVLTEEERVHLTKTLESFRKGKIDEFVSLDKA